MSSSTMDMERSIARCRVFLSLAAILAIYIDPSAPAFTRWLPLTGGPFAVNRYWVTVLLAHLTYSLSLAWAQQRPVAAPKRTSPQVAILASRAGDATGRCCAQASDRL